MDNGWIKLHRKICESDLWFKETFTKAMAWVDLILIANHKDGMIMVRGNVVKVKRGQVGYSQQSLSRRWKWSRKKVANFLNLLEREHQIEQHKNNVSSLITILNYNTYQEKEQQKKPQRNSRRTAEEPQKNTNKNDKNVKNDKNNNATNVADYPMTLIQFYNWTKKSNQRHIHIIGEYADTVKPNFETKKQWEVFLKRNLRPAKDLSPFTDEQIIDAVSEIKKAQGEGWLKKYTLETLIKFLK